MYLRVANVKAAPEEIDKAIGAFEQQVVPGARTQPGYMGAALIVDRQTGEAAGITRWESLEALNASERFTLEARRQIVASGVANILDVDRYEMVIEEALGEASAPGYIRINEFYMQPDRIDALTAFMRERVAGITSQKGCRAVLMGVNRMTGHSFVNSVWATADDRQASEAGVSGLRQEAGSLAGAEPAVRLGEVAFVEMRQPVKQG